MADMFENIKKGDCVLITQPLRVPGTHYLHVFRKTTVTRVYKNTFLVDGAKFYKQNGDKEYSRDSRHDHRKVRPIGGKWSELAAKDECGIGENIASLNLVMEIAKKIEDRSNTNLVRNRTACDLIKNAMLEINKLLQENS